MSIVKTFKLVCLLILLVLFIPMFTACQSTDKTESYLSTKQTNFEYDNVTNTTEVSWKVEISNETIYNIKGFSADLKLYSGDVLLETKNVNYNISLNHGGKYNNTLYFTADGNINKIELKSWTATHVSFWGTYSLWFIISLSIVGVIALVYLILIIIMDFDLEDAWEAVADFFEDKLWLLFILLIPFGGAVYGFVSNNWVPVLIILGALVVNVLLILLLHLIRYLIGIGGRSYRGGVYKTKKSINASKMDITEKTIDDCKNNIKELLLFTSAELKEYCKEKGITGYSGLTKEEIAHLIKRTDISKLSIQKGNDISKNTTKTNNVNKSKKAITFDDIAGLEDAKQAFKEKVVLALEHKDLYEKFGKKVGGGILLYGLPGTGKTMFAEAASNETNSLFIPIKCSDIKSKWYGESEGKVKDIFNKASKAGKAIIFFDEFEAIGAKRTNDADNGNNDLVPQILAEMQGVKTNNSNSIIVVIAATNKPWAIDSAFIRPGRFDEKIYIPLPDEAARTKIFELKLKDIPTADLDYAEMAKITEGFNGADINEFCEKLKMGAIRKSIKDGVEHIITMDDVLAIANKVKSSVSDEDIENLQKFQKKYS